MCLTVRIRSLVFIALALILASLPTVPPAIAAAQPPPKAPAHLFVGPYDPLKMMVYDGPLFHDTRLLHLWWTPMETAGTNKLLARITTSRTRLSVSATHDSGDDAITYHWEIVKAPNGANMNLTPWDRTPVYHFIRDGDYTFRVTVADQNGKSVTSTVEATVRMAVAPQGPASS